MDISQDEFADATGSTDLAPVDWTEQVENANDKWQKFCKNHSEISKLRAYEGGFGEGKDFVHDNLKHVVNATGKLNTPGETCDLFKTIQEDKVNLLPPKLSKDDIVDIKKMMIRITKTHPFKIAPKEHWHNRQPPSHDVMSTWLAAYHLFGAPWKSNSPLFKSVSLIAPSPTQPKQTSDKQKEASQQQEAVKPVTRGIISRPRT